LGRTVTAGIRKRSCRLIERRKAGLAFPRAWKRVEVIMFRPTRGIPRSMITIAFFPSYR
jgi:hypothetical protein